MNEESAANSDSLGESSPVVTQLYLTAKSSYFRFICSFQELYYTFFSVVSVFSGLFSHLVVLSPFASMF